MTFFPSSEPDITEGLPNYLSAKEESSGYVSTGTRYDLAVGGVTFLAAISKERPYLRESAPIQKQQFDSSKEAGEQTLDQFWLRSQTSWHRGQNVVFYEPGTDELSQYRYAESMGVNPWTKGSVTLLKKCPKIATVAGAQVAYATTAVIGGADVVFTNENGTVRRRLSDGTSVAYTGTTAATSKVAVAGSNVLVGASTAIWSGSASGSTLTSLWTGAPAAVQPYWAKSRIIATSGPNVYELTMVGGTMPTALYTHPDANWTWTSVAESPSGILLAGYGSGYGAVYNIGLQDASSGSVPELGQVYQVAELPPGEEIHAMRVYLGTYLGLGTSRGLRVGLVGDGQVQVGPLTVETTKPVRSLGARDAFLYAAVEAAMPDGSSGCVRVNLSEQIEPLLFAWAFDAQTHTIGRVDSVAFYGVSDRVVLGVYGEGVYAQSATLYEASGYITSGRIRYGTIEPKSFQLADLGAKLPGGSVSFYVLDGKSEVFIRALDDTAPDGAGLGIGVGGKIEYLSFKVKLSASTDGLLSPVIESLQIKAVPAPRRQRLIKYPLLCFDHERPGSGAPVGREGWAWARIQALEELESEKVTVNIQDLVTGESFLALIEQVSFERSGPRSGDNRPNFGGFVQLTVRKFL